MLGTKIIVTQAEADFFNSKYRGAFANSDLNEAILLLRDWDKFNSDKKQPIKKGSIKIVSGKHGWHLKVNGLFINAGFQNGKPNIIALKGNFGVPYGATEWLSIPVLRKFWAENRIAIIAATSFPHQSVWGNFFPIQKTES
jgi:hypothetical protein